MLALEADSAMDYKLNCSVWRRPYAEVLLAIRFERLLTILAATEIAVFQRLRELAADQDATSLFCGQVAPGVQLDRDARRSENIESCRTPASEEL
jgi:hypothetical protein